jgi:UDP-2,3-diacylglucosamine hydrolase
MSSKSRKKTMKYSEANQDEIKNMIRSHAQKVYLEKPFDLIVTGHMHVEDDYMFKVDGKEVRSINLGTWLNRPVSLKIENNKIEWILLT